MEVINDLSDDEFVPFLRSLGVETYNKSFEWMLNDPEFGGVLQWLYDNVDQSNALTAREKYRYNELQKSGALLSEEDLKASIKSIQEKHPYIYLPGDKKSKQDIKMLIKMQKERLCMLEKQEKVVKDLINENDMINKQLNVDLTRLNSASNQFKEDEAKATKESIKMAKELKNMTNNVIQEVAKGFDVYATLRRDKEAAKESLVLSHLESYKQSQDLFRSHFELYVTKNLANKQIKINDADMRAALEDAKNLEKRLSEAALAYIISKAELSGERAKLEMLANYKKVHRSKISSCLAETQCALEVLLQETSTQEQLAHNTVKDFVENRTNIVFNTAASAALDVRLRFQNSLTHLVDVWQQAYSLDQVVYYVLRHEMTVLQQFLELAAKLQIHVICEEEAVTSRLNSMKKIIAEHASCVEKLQSSNPLTEALCSILKAPLSDSVIPVKAYKDLQECLKELTQNVQDGFKEKEDKLVQLEKSTTPFQDFIWSGSTKQLYCCDRTVALLSHSLTQKMTNLDKRVREAMRQFIKAKEGDAENLRKLWQWFLTDQSKFLAAMKKIQDTPSTYNPSTPSTSHKDA